MRAKKLLRVDTAVLIVLARLGEDASLPDVMQALQEVDINCDKSTIHRAADRLQEEGLITHTGHDFREARHLTRVYSASIRGQQEATARVERLAGMLGLNTQIF